MTLVSMEALFCLFEKFVQGVATMRGERSGAQLGEVPLHGER